MPMDTQTPDSGDTDRQTPPTAVGSTFTITDLGTKHGGEAISIIRDAFANCFGDLVLVVETEHGNREAYSFKGRSPIYCCHVPDDRYERAEHGLQTVGFRYNYRFIRDIETAQAIHVVDWDETQFPEVEEVVYP